jgi:mannan endo-1,4-beta-mannosidase
VRFRSLFVILSAMLVVVGVAGVALTTLGVSASPTPAAGQTVADSSGASLPIEITPGSAGSATVEAVPTNAVAVSQVFWYLDSTFEGTDLSAPYCLGGTAADGSCTPLDTSGLADGTHTVSAYMSYNQGSLESQATFTVEGGVVTTTPSAPASTTTTTAPPTTTTTAPTTSPSSSVSTPFIGLNVYELASAPGVNLGCGQSFNGQWASFFSSLPKGTVVRFWATQQMATSAADPSELDWTVLDQVFSTAATYGIHLIPVLGNEWTNCDGLAAVQKTLPWFEGGYQSNTDEGPVPYLQWVQAIVSRYASSPATYMWEPINEPQPTNADGTCTSSTAAQALRGFFTEVGGAIHSIDPTHPVESGLLGEGNCGTANGDFAIVGSSPGIDVLTYHDYYPADETEGGDQYNGIAKRIAQAKELGKPILVGEDGIEAGNGCSISLSQRAGDFAGRADAQFAAGAMGMLFWDYEPSPSDCTYDIGPGDPALGLLGGAG